MASNQPYNPYLTHQSYNSRPPPGVNNNVTNNGKILRGPPGYRYYSSSYPVNQYNPQQGAPLYQQFPPPPTTQYHSAGFIPPMQQTQMQCNTVQSNQMQQSSMPQTQVNTSYPPPSPSLYSYPQSPQSPQMGFKSLPPSPGPPSYLPPSPVIPSSPQLVAGYRSVPPSPPQLQPPMFRVNHAVKIEAPPTTESSVKATTGKSFRPSHAIKIVSPHTNQPSTLASSVHLSSCPSPSAKRSSVKYAFTSTTATPSTPPSTRYASACRFASPQITSSPPPTQTPQRFAMKPGKKPCVETLTSRRKDETKISSEVASPQSKPTFATTTTSVRIGTTESANKKSLLDVSGKEQMSTSTSNSIEENIKPSSIPKKTPMSSTAKIATEMDKGSPCQQDETVLEKLEACAESCNSIEAEREHSISPRREESFVSLPSAGDGNNCTWSDNTSTEDYDSADDFIKEEEPSPADTQLRWGPGQGKTELEFAILEAGEDMDVDEDRLYTPEGSDQTDSDDQHDEDDDAILRELTEKFLLLFEGQESVEFMSFMNTFIQLSALQRKVIMTEGGLRSFLQNSGKFIIQGDTYKLTPRNVKARARLSDGLSEDEELAFLQQLAADIVRHAIEIAVEEYSEEIEGNQAQESSESIENSIPISPSKTEETPPKKSSTISYEDIRQKFQHFNDLKNELFSEIGGDQPRRKSLTIPYNVDLAKEISDTRSLPSFSPRTRVTIDKMSTSDKQSRNVRSELSKSESELKQSKSSSAISAAHSDDNEDKSSLQSSSTYLRWSVADDRQSTLNSEPLLRTSAASLTTSASISATTSSLPAWQKEQGTSTPEAKPKTASSEQSSPSEFMAIRAPTKTTKYRFDINSPEFCPASASSSSSSIAGATQPKLNPEIPEFHPSLSAQSIVNPSAKWQSTDGKVLAHTMQRIPLFASSPPCYPAPNIPAAAAATNVSKSNFISAAVSVHPRAAVPSSPVLNTALKSVVLPPNASIEIVPASPPNIIAAGSSSSHIPVSLGHIPVSTGHIPVSTGHIPVSPSLPVPPLFDNEASSSIFGDGLLPVPQAFANNYNSFAAKQMNISSHRQPQSLLALPILPPPFPTTQYAPWATGHSLISPEKEVNRQTDIKSPRRGIAISTCATVQTDELDTTFATVQTDELDMRDRSSNTELDVRDCSTNTKLDVRECSTNTKEPPTSCDVCVNTVESDFSKEMQKIKPVVKTVDKEIMTETKELEDKEVQTQLYGKNFYKDRETMTDEDIRILELKMELQALNRRALVAEEKVYAFQQKLDKALQQLEEEKSSMSLHKDKEQAEDLEKPCKKVCHDHPPPPGLHSKPALKADDKKKKPERKAPPVKAASTSWISPVKFEIPSLAFIRNKVWGTTEHTETTAETDDKKQKDTVEEKKENVATAAVSSSAAAAVSAAASSSARSQASSIHSSGSATSLKASSSDASVSVRASSSYGAVASVQSISRPTRKEDAIDSSTLASGGATVPGSYATTSFTDTLSGSHGKDNYKNNPYVASTALAGGLDRKKIIEQYEPVYANMKIVLAQQYPQLVATPQKLDDMAWQCLLQSLQQIGLMQQQQQQQQAIGYTTVPSLMPSSSSTQLPTQTHREEINKAVTQPPTAQPSVNQSAQVLAKTPTAQPSAQIPVQPLSARLAAQPPAQPLSAQLAAQPPVQPLSARLARTHAQPPVQPLSARLAAQPPAQPLSARLAEKKSAVVSIKQLNVSSTKEETVKPPAIPSLLDLQIPMQKKAAQNDADQSSASLNRFKLNRNTKLIEFAQGKDKDEDRGIVQPHVRNILDTKTSSDEVKKIKEDADKTTALKYTPFKSAVSKSIASSTSSVVPPLFAAPPTVPFNTASKTAPPGISSASSKVAAPSIFTSASTQSPFATSNTDFYSSQSCASGVATSKSRPLLDSTSLSDPSSSKWSVMDRFAPNYMPAGSKPTASKSDAAKGFSYQEAVTYFDQFAPAYEGKAISTISTFQPRDRSVATAHYNPDEDCGKRTSVPLRSTAGPVYPATQATAHPFNGPRFNPSGTGLPPQYPPTASTKPPTTVTTASAKPSPTFTAPTWSAAGVSKSKLDQLDDFPALPLRASVWDQLAKGDAEKQKDDGKAPQKLVGGTSAMGDAEEEEWHTVGVKCPPPMPPPPLPPAQAAKRKGSMASIVAGNQSAKAASYSKLVEKIQENLPRLTTEQITNLIQSVRDNHGGLKGIPMRDIISEINDIVRQRGLGMRSLSASKKPAAEKTVLAAGVVAKKPPTHCIYAHSDKERDQQRKMFPQEKKPHTATVPQKKISLISGESAVAARSLHAPTSAMPSSYNCLQPKDMDTSMDENDCPICFGAYTDDGNKQMTLECGHTYHHDCIQSWITRERTCPLCRRYTLTDEEFPALGGL